MKRVERERVFSALRNRLQEGPLIRRYVPEFVESVTDDVLAALDAAPDADAGRAALKILPDCMMPDGAEPCIGYTEALQRIATLERDLATARGRIERALEIALHKMRAILRGDSDA